MTTIDTSTLVAMAEKARASADFAFLEMTEKGLHLRLQRRTPGKLPASFQHQFSWQEIAASRDPVQWVALQTERGEAMISRLIETGAETFD